MYNKKLDVNNTSSLLKRIRELQSNNEFWAQECEKLHTLGWYKFFVFMSCALNLTFIFCIIGWLIWME